MKTMPPKLASLLALLILTGCTTLSPWPQAGLREPVQGNISISLDDVELQDVVMLFRRITDANIAANPEYLKGRCTANLDDLPWPKALEMVLSVHNLELRHPASNVYSIVPGKGFTCPADAGEEPILDSFWGIIGLAALIIAAFFGALHFIRLLLKLTQRIMSRLRERRARPRIIQLALRIIYFLLLLYYCLAGAIYAVFRFTDFSIHNDNTGAYMLTHVVLPAAGAFLLLAAALAALRKYFGPFRPRTRVALWLVLITPAFFMLIDSPAPKPAYTLEDLSLEFPDLDKADQLLARLNTRGEFPVMPEYQMWMDDYSATNILAHAGEIDDAWLAISDARNMIRELGSCERIAERITPAHLSWNTAIPAYAPLRTIARTYQQRALLQCAGNDLKGGIATLSELHSAVLKMLPDTAYLITRMIAVAIASQNIETAHRILNDYDCSESDLRVLQKSFPQLSSMEITLQRPFILENLYMTSTFKADDLDDRFLQLFTCIFVWNERVSSYVPPATNGTVIVYGGHGETNRVFWTKTQQASDDFFYDGRLPPLPGFWTRTAGKIIAFLFYNPNRTVRDYDLFSQALISAHAGRWPDETLINTFTEDYSSNPDIRNLAGWLLVSITSPSFSRCHKSNAEVIVRSDLLAMTISERLGEDPVLRDYISDAQYSKDLVTGEWFSKGPDRRRSTDDDIRLEWGY